MDTKMTMVMKTALVTDIQRFSIHDGPGIRTTVFFKGCPLSCLWCHNPETVRFQNEPMYTRKDCIGCGDCVAACPGRALTPGPEGIRTDWDACTGCLECAAACPSGARSPAAAAYTPDELLAEVVKDRDFFGEEGGVTLSGGEPLAHPGFLEEFIPKVRESGLHLAVETCGYWVWEKLEPLLSLVDLFLIDIKAVDPKLHKLLTGKSNGLILENMARLAESGHEVWLRMPFIPGKNDGKKNLAQTADLASRLGFARLTLLPYHNFGQTKSEKIRPGAQPLEIKAPSEERLQEVREFFASREIEIKSA